MRTLRLGTRGSTLARAQAGQVADSLRALGAAVEHVVVTTTGDRVQDRPLREAGGKGLFVKELELALLDGRVDFCVHSIKDVPTTEPVVDQTGLVIAAVPARGDVRDVLVGAGSLEALPRGARVGTGSLRRRALLLHARPDLDVRALRGNIDTRLGRLGEFDALVLAAAGLDRAGLFDAARMARLDVETMLPAPGQGALALQCRREDVATAELLRALDDPAASAAVRVERALVARLGCDCRSPVAALAEARGDGVRLRAALAPDGRDGPVAFAEGGGGAEGVEWVARRLRAGLASAV